MKGIATAMILIGIILTAGAAGAVDHETVSLVVGILTGIIGLALLFTGGWLARKVMR